MMYGQSLLSNVYVHKTLPLVVTQEMVFFRCVQFKDEFYGKTVSELHRGNLRENKSNNRFSNLFPGLKTSYWSNSPDIARAEIKKHGASNDIITFFAYDDLTSTFPSLPNDEKIILINGEDYRISDIIEKSEEGITLTNNDKDVLEKIMKYNPDCLVFKSRIDESGLNYLFFEKGFNKLAIREVKLRLGTHPGKNTARIGCAYSSDYWPVVENYGKFFDPIARVKMNEKYLETDEYKMRKTICDKSHQKMHEGKR
ncbi:hypothetical protein [Candidatus Methanarcanum hacksteinii]|uniref:hypothetical protein n=1 Tax=Candidatus Methanarcanum hacksteinii TaxID=2911857 RepID=UPI0037DC5AB0